MAEGGISYSQQSHGPPKVNSLCKYFVHGACSKGENCRFIHDRSGTVPSDNICKYYQLGKCTFGQRCRYDHVRKENDQVRREGAAVSTQRGSSRPVQPQRNWGSFKSDEPQHNWGSFKSDEPQRNWGSFKSDEPQRNWGSFKSDEPQRNGGSFKSDEPQRNGGSSRPVQPQRNWGSFKSDEPQRNGGSSRPAQPQHNWGSFKPVQPQQNTRSRAVPEQRQSQMVTLSKGRKNGGVDYKHMQKKRAKDEKWAQAKSFVPGQKYSGACPSSYAAAIGGEDDWNGEYRDHADAHYMATATAHDGRGGLPLQLVTAETPLCSFYAAGACRDDDDCPYVHGDICDMCGLPQLHPANKKQQQEHRRECLADHEREMEKAFAVAASEGMECGICLESVLQKFSSTGSPADSRFGVLENCNHCFCLSCIRQWRGHKEESMEMQRTCPTCRTHSDFIVPSKYWVETAEDKAKLIEDYKKALKRKPCHYFKKGKGACPFNRKCFYLHALPDGTEVEENLVSRRRRTNADGETTLAEDFSLWSFLEDRDDTVDDLLMRVRDLMGDDYGDNYSDSDLSGGLYLYYDSSSSDD